MSGSVVEHLLRMYKALSSIEHHQKKKKRERKEKKREDKEKYSRYEIPLQEEMWKAWEWEPWVKENHTNVTTTKECRKGHKIHKL